MCLIRTFVPNNQRLLNAHIQYFKVKKEERWLAFAMLAVFVTFNAMVIASHYHVYTMDVHGGFWSIFTKNFRMSGYDCWSWITVSGRDVSHFVYITSSLYLTFLYPLYLLNDWLIQNVGYNFAVYFMAVIIVFSAFYAVLFMYRVFREVLELRRKDARLLNLVVILFWTRTHSNYGARPLRCFSDAALSDALHHGEEDEERTITNRLAIVGSDFLHGRNGNIKRGEDSVSRLSHQWKEGLYR